MRTWIVFFSLVLGACAQEFDTSTILLKPKAGIQVAARADATHYHLLPWMRVPAKPGDMDNLRASGLYEKVEYARIVRTCVIPNDAEWTNQWGPMKIQAEAAWDLRTSNDVVVAIIDTGIDFNHPDLAPNLWTGVFGEHGYTAIGGQLVEGGQDDHFHGTHVAGTIGAFGNNGIGIAGLNWRCKLMAMKFLNSGGSGSDADAAAAVEKLIELRNGGVNVRVGNNSWGGAGGSSILEDVFALAEQAGIIMVCAAGNSNTDDDTVPFFPAGFTNNGVVTVIASDINDEKASFSSYGLTTTDLLAPGVNVLSCKLGGGYWNLSGTSMAAPHVAGVCAMMFGVQPNLTVAACKSILLDRDSLDRVSFTENTTLGGRLNMALAVGNALTRPIEANTNLSPKIVLNVATNLVVLPPGGSVTISATASDPNGDELIFASRTSGGRQYAYPLFTNFVDPIVRGENTITLTNRPKARDLAVRGLWSVIDGHGGADTKGVTVFMQRATNLVRDLNPVIGSVRIAPSSTPYRTNVFIDAPHDVRWFLYHGNQEANGVYGGATWYCCAAGDEPHEIVVWQGLNIAHAYCVDGDGNYLDVGAATFTGYYSNQPPAIEAPFSLLTLSKLSAPSPANFLADMRASDPDGTQHYSYFRDYWLTFGSDFDFSNPIKSFGITELGMHPMSFTVYGQANLADSSLALLTVLPAGMTNEPPPMTNPPPVMLIAPQDLSVSASASTIALRWSDASTGESEWRVERATKSRGPWGPFKQVAVLAANTTAYAQPRSSGQFQFRVRACKDSNCSPYSNAASIRVR